jgi:hypothetical protein
VGTLTLMAYALQLPDPDRRRRRLQLLAEFSDARSLRERLSPRSVAAEQVRALLASRRRTTGERPEAS